LRRQKLTIIMSVV